MVDTRRDADIEVFSSPFLTYQQPSYITRSPNPEDILHYNSSADITCHNEKTGNLLEGDLCAPRYVMCVEDDVKQRDADDDWVSIGGSMSLPRRKKQSLTGSEDLRRSFSKKHWVSSSQSHHHSSAFAPQARYHNRFHQTDGRKSMFQMPSSIGHTEKYKRGALKIGCTATECGHTHGSKLWADQITEPVKMVDSFTQVNMDRKKKTNTVGVQSEVETSTIGTQAELAQEPVKKIKPKPKLKRMTSTVQYATGVYPETPLFENVAASITNIGVQCTLPCGCDKVRTGNTHVVVPVPAHTEGDPVIKITTDKCNMSTVQFTCSPSSAAPKGTCINTLSYQERPERIAYGLSSVRRSASSVDPSHQRLDYRTDTSNIARTLAGTLASKMPRLFNKTQKQAMKMTHHRLTTNDRNDLRSPRILNTTV